MVRFADFDSRGYRTVDVRTGYGQWVRSYEETVLDAMDLGLLRRLTVPSWGSVRRAADLGCGTGRTGVWLRERGVAAVDGVDLTPQMLRVAGARGVHDRLVEADVSATGLAGGGYDLVIASLVDEHLPRVGPLYEEAWRLAAPGGLFVVVAYHPFFIMVSGMPTHFTDVSGEPVAIDTHIHLPSEHVTAGLAAGWALAEMCEGLVDADWVAAKPKWERFRGFPISAALVWRRGYSP